MFASLCPLITCSNAESDPTLMRSQLLPSSSIDGIPTKKADRFFCSPNNEIEIDREMVSHWIWLLYNAITGV